MSRLHEYTRDPSKDAAKVLKTLEELTKECQVAENREKMDTQILLDLTAILNYYLGQPISSDSRTQIAFSILAESFRFLRNSVINCKGNQDFIRNKTDVILDCLDFLKSSSEHSDDSTMEMLLVPTRCCLQFIANVMVDNEDNGRLMSSKVNETLCVLLKSSADEKVVQYAAMGLHLVLKLNPLWIGDMDISFIPALFKHTHLEFIMIVIETLGTNDAFMKTKYIQLITEDRVSFLKVLVAHTEVHQHFPGSILTFLAEEFKSKSDLILKSQIESDEWVCWEVASLLELLCCVSTMESPLTADNSLLTNVVFLLRSVHAVGKASNLGENQFTPIQGLSQMRINEESEELRASPTFQFKAHLIRLLANLVHRNFRNQEMVREIEGLAVVLDCCQIDARNPFITQWSVLAIRNLCEGNPANQEFIREVQRVDTENKLPSLQMIGL